ncbi:MAG TPA: GMC family oxidoreductase [Kofleriaceae bacterium]|nr:GMC family oxidoreductase [Kofleriaceae bacterium]
MSGIRTPPRVTGAMAATPLGRVPEHFDAVVIGSGFGGSVMAHRLAEAGQAVCVLERGQEHRPGTFPRAPHLVRTNFWDPSAGLYGMYNIWFFRHVGALVSSGLGGGSLIYANVLLRKDERWFVHEDLGQGGFERWPVGRAELDPHYERVEAVLAPQLFPQGVAPYDQAEKVNAFRIAAERTAARTPGCTVERTPIAVTLYNDPARPRPGEVIEEEVRNRYDFPRRTCVLCGECVVGCNYGSKNTLDLTYLSRAEQARRPAVIRTRAEVRTFRPRPGGGYEVTYVVHDVEARRGVPFSTRALEPVTVTCDRLVLAAGTFGSTYLLLKNQDALPNLSRAHVGTRFSGNGDLLSFALMSTKRVDERVEPWRVDPTRGPTITHALRRADAVDAGAPGGGRGFYIEDAGFPSELAWMVEGLHTLGWLSRSVRFARRFLRKALGGDRDTDLATELSDLLGPMNLTSRSLPLLGMGRDVPDGKFSLDPEQGRLQLDWGKRRSGAYFDELTETAEQIAKELGGKFSPNPVAKLFERAVTVHPLGGCPMGECRDEGVVDAYGRVFGHPGLVIADGSVLPGPVGPNPALTIAAVADRAADELAAWRPGATWPA